MHQTIRKSPHPIDRHVGSRIRMRHALLGMTQQRLADDLGITFQQVQKYEKGTNRVSASRLQHIASLLEVDVGFLYEGSSHGPDGGTVDLPHALLSEISNSSEGPRLINSFARITDPVVRRRLADLAESLAQSFDGTVAGELQRTRRRGAVMAPQSQGRFTDPGGVFLA